MASESGELLYKFYRVLTYSLSPLIHLHVRWRKFWGREHLLRWRERLGRPSLPRPPGPLIWFHAVSLGEGIAAIPVIKCCVERSPDVAVLMTTTTTSAFEVIKNQLPSDVLYQFAPLDIPTVMDAFLHYWKPNAIILLESELWPNLIMGAAKNGIPLTLLNGRMSERSFLNWSQPAILPLTRLMLSKFSLILPLSTAQGIRFQLLQAPPFIINFCGDLKCVIDDFGVLEEDGRILKDFQGQLAHRKVWMASSIHKGEEDVILRAHIALKDMHPDIATIIVPRQPQHGREIARKLRKQGILVALRSHRHKLTPGTNIYIVDSLGELRDFYRLTPIAVVGGSFLPGFTGHNMSEAAAAGCAVLTGHYIGHFSSMVQEMQRSNPLSVMLVSREELVEVVNELLYNDKILEARRRAAKQAYDSLSSGVVENVWRLLHIHVFHKSIAGRNVAGSEKVKNMKGV